MVTYLPDSVAFESMRTAVVAGTHYEIASARPVPGAWLVELRGIESREQAAAVRGAEVLALRSELGPLEPDEYFAADLIGLLAVLPDGTPVGVVSGIVDHGGGDILVLEPHGQGAGRVEERMILLAPGVLLGVHLAEGRLVIAPTEDA